MHDFVKQFLACESAATAIEYALIASLIALAIVSVLNNMATRLKRQPH
jgi:pilus assembly protein Flp/PilA